MSAVVKKQQVLPPVFAELLRIMHAGEDPRLDAVMELAYANGWTLTAMASALGVTRERIRQRVARATGFVDIPVPLPPRHQTPPPPPDRRLRLKPELAEQLREMCAVASTVNGGMDVDDPARRVSERFSAQLAAYVEQGVSIYHLAQVLGVTFGAIRSRLVRHGYLPPAPSQAGKPQHIYLNRKVGGQNLTSCQRGHDLTGDNLRVEPSGRRICRACESRRAAAYYQRRKQATAAA